MQNRSGSTRRPSPQPGPSSKVGGYKGLRSYPSLHSHIQREDVQALTGRGAGGGGRSSHTVPPTLSSAQLSSPEALPVTAVPCPKHSRPLTRSPWSRNKFHPNRSPPSPLYLLRAEAAVPERDEDRAEHARWRPEGRPGTPLYRCLSQENAPYAAVKSGEAEPPPREELEA